MVNALTALRAVSFPAVHPRFAFAAILRREGDSEGPLSLRFVRETESEDEVLLTVDGSNQTPEKAQFYTNFPIGIRLFDEGTIKFRLEIQEGEADWYTVGSQSIEVSSIEQQGKMPQDKTASEDCKSNTRND
jgi:hypothetical protein